VTVVKKSDANGIRAKRGRGICNKNGRYYTPTGNNTLEKARLLLVKSLKIWNSRYLVTVFDNLR
jgi:hypothetical protein